MERLIAYIASSIAGAIAVGMVIWGLMAALDSNHLSSAVSNAAMIYQNAAGTFDSGIHALNYSGMSNQVAVAAKIIPDTMDVQGGTVYGPWKGSTLTLSSSRGGQELVETWTNVPASNCPKFAMSQKTDSVIINGQTIKTSDPFMAQQVATACNGENSKTATIAFAY